MAQGLQHLRKFVAPEIVFGEHALELAGRYASNFGGSRVLVVTDEGVLRAGWAQKVMRVLERRSIPYAVFSELTINPKASEVMRGADFYLRQGCDIIIAVGGGSAMDCAKGIGIVSANNAHILEFEGVDSVPIPGPPLICIPTTAGSAADVSQFAIISDEARKVKVAIISKALVPDVSLIDPLTTISMTPEVTIACGFDALTHGIESYVSDAHSPLTDIHALNAVSTIRDALPRVVQNPESIEARKLMSLASTHAGLAFSNASLGLVHAMAHAVGGLTDAIHGECNAVLLPVVVGFNFSETANRYETVCREIGLDTGDLSRQQLKQQLVDAIAAFKKRTGFIKCLGDLGVTRDMIPILAINASHDLCLATNPRTASPIEIQELYETALECTR